MGLLRASRPQSSVPVARLQFTEVDSASSSMFRTSLSASLIARSAHRYGIVPRPFSKGSCGSPMGTERGAESEVPNGAQPWADPLFRSSA